MTVKGQVSTETAIMIVFVIGALALMMFYVQRAVQGGLLSGTSALGLQFDPRDPYEGGENLRPNDTVTVMVRGGTVGAYLRDGRLANSKASLPDIPTGPIHREPAQQEVAVTANWTGGATASYCEERTGACPP